MLSDELFGVSNMPVGGVDIVVVDQLDQIMVCESSQGFGSFCRLGCWPRWLV